ncbi:MAG TPA: MFS transporter [Syntrophobacteria bacterium]|nr:MFS transporter [Syntrophobacteria bacterium]
MILRRKLSIVAVLYFAEGFPFGIIRAALPVYFRMHGVSLQALGLLDLLRAPWAAKFLWAPAVDSWGEYRRWMAGSQCLISLVLLIVMMIDPSSPSLVLWTCLMSLAFLSATQDIAIDAYTIRLLGKQEMGIANGVRISSYRVALLLAGGVFVALGGWIGWRVAFSLAAVVLALCTLVSLSVPRPPIDGNPKRERALLQPIRDLLGRPRARQVLCFILLYTLGDTAMGPMVRPFWVDRGLSTTEIGLITGSIGLIATITGALVGGAFTTRFGVFHGLWFLGIWQAVSNLGYAAVARLPETGHWGVYGASIVESFCGGLGSAAFLAFLMSICSKRWAATQYAILSALFNVPGLLFGSLSGWAAARLGYSTYFGLTFLLAVPAYAFIFATKGWGTAETAPAAEKESSDPTP